MKSATTSHLLEHRAKQKPINQSFTEVRHLVVVSVPFNIIIHTRRRRRRRHIIIMENYKVMKALGSGTWGVVHMAEQKGTGRIVAVKKIKSEKPEEGINFTAVREIKLLRDFHHENIIELVDCFTTPDLAICLVYECAYTDLEKILANKAIPIGLADVKQHLLSLLTAIEACHERWILHRDLKPDNMLYLPDGTMKLADFGLARMCTCV
jgi:cyclin-dependent kinase 7